MAGYEDNDQTQAEPDGPRGSEGSNQPNGPERLDGPDEKYGPRGQDLSRSNWPRQNISGYGELSSDGPNSNRPSSDGPSSNQPRCEKKDSLQLILS